MKTSEIIAAVENGAKWQYLCNKVWQTPLHQIKNHENLKYLCKRISDGTAVRLAPQKKTVPLGPEDFVCQCWWLRSDEDDTCPVMVTGAGPERVYYAGESEKLYADLKRHNWQRSKDGKTWEPCSKTVEG